jgi:hypothetical protein
MNPQLTKSQWCSLPQEIRNKLREIFGVQKSEGCEVVNNMIVSDGSSHQDLQAISVASMQAFLYSEEDNFAKLFDLVMLKLNPIEDQIEVYEEPVMDLSARVEEPIVDEVISDIIIPKESTVPPELQAVIDAAAPKQKSKGCPKGGWPKKEIINANQNENETKETSQD